MELSDELERAAAEAEAFRRELADYFDGGAEQRELAFDFECPPGTSKQAELPDKEPRRVGEGPSLVAWLGEAHVCQINHRDDAHGLVATVEPARGCIVVAPSSARDDGDGASV